MVAQAAATSREEYNADAVAAARHDMFLKACRTIPYLQLGNSDKSAKDMEREEAAKKYKQYLLKVSGNGDK